MANCALMIEWGMPIEGREHMALEMFLASVQWWMELKDTGKIEGFHTYGPLTGNFAERSGLAIVEGSSDQIHAMRTSEDYRLRMNRILNIVHNVNQTLLETGDDMTVRMQRYGRTLKELKR